jgi:hypothetical protein
MTFLDTVVTKMLKHKIQNLSGEFELWELTSPLPCCRILESGQTCLRDARYALVYPKRTDEFVVYPYCDEHLPRKVSLAPSASKISKKRK